MNFNFFFSGVCVRWKSPRKKVSPQRLQSSWCWETISGTPREIWKYGAAILRLFALPMLMQRWYSLIFHALIETLCELLLMGVAETFACRRTGKKPRFPLAPSQTVFCRFLITEALNKLNNTGGGDQRSLSLAPKLILERSAHNRFADLRMHKHVSLCALSALQLPIITQTLRWECLPDVLPALWIMNL